MNRKYFGFAIIVTVSIFLGLFTKNVFAACDGSCCYDFMYSYCVPGYSTSSCGPCPDTKCYITCTLARYCYKASQQTGGKFCAIVGEESCTAKWINDTYPNGSTITCCSQINCSCTPTCPAGTSTTVTGSSCSAGASSCSQSNDCSSCSTTGATCYYPETNVVPSAPTNISMIVDGTTYQLSTNPNSPTKIKLPLKGSSNVQVSIPTFTAPTTSRGGGYYFTADNYGTNNQWKGWVSCSGTAGEDFCTTVPSTNSTQNFIPTSLTVAQVLKENAMGKISGMYTTTNKCADTYKYSLPIEGYYVVDTVPTTVPPTIEADTTNKGCTSSTYTGLEINNPLHIVAQTSDTNGLDEIQAFILWFSKDTTVPTVGTITASYTGSNNTDFGIMIKKNGATWLNPSVYVTNSSQTWGPVSNGDIQISGTNIVKISSISVTQSTNVTFDYKLEFLNNPNNLSGMYNVYGEAIDSYMINGSTIDQNYFIKFFDWGIDLVNPTVDDIVKETKDPTSTYLTWNTSDTTSGIGRVIINGYRVGGTVTDTARLYLPTAYTTLKGGITLGPKPTDSEIGLYTDTMPKAWQFSTSGEKDLINIGSNEGGSIDIYVTAYDKACNTNVVSKDIDLNPWFATRGGSIYSSGNITTSAKDVSTSTSLDGVFNVKTAMTKDKLDIGTELLATKGTYISGLIHPAKAAVRGTLLYDSNTEKTYHFDQLITRFGRYMPNSTQFTNLTTGVSIDCTSGTSCYMYSESLTHDIHIPSGYVCDKKAIIISSHDIYLEPDITSGTSLSGCIFLAKNNIYIGAGTYKSNGSTVVKYDYLEGYLIADNQIIFSLVDTEVSKPVRDGVEIFGGMVAFGANPPAGESAISIKRNLKLFSQINPTVVVTYDNKYPAISTIFLGTEAPIYRQEVGFKSF